MEVTVEVPVRVCDVGGWTDTWFAGRGRVCSLAVGPGVSVRARTRPGTGQLTFDLVDYGVTFPLGSEPPEHRLLAAVAQEAGPLDGVDVALRISSAVPPGSSLGTSAAVSVAVLLALDTVGHTPRPPDDLARAAHRAEAGRLGRQSGVQDQVAAAHGGANLIEITEYPRVVRHDVSVPPATWHDLGERLLHIAYGAPHDSSAVHDEVIASLDADGPDAPRLEALRALAGDAAHALRSGDLVRYGAVLTAATDAQAALHPALVSDDARRLIDLARDHGASGWKVNGAGGEGGSLSILCRSAADRELVQGDARALGHHPVDLALAAAGAQVVQR